MLFENMPLILAFVDEKRKIRVPWVKTMRENSTAIKVENISKCYRIGLKEEIHDNMLSIVLDFLKSPLTNYRKYRSLYKFHEIDDNGANSGDVIWALKDVSFEVKKGEAIGIIGRNGAGKSTLLKVLSKITDPTSGKAEIRGRVSSLLEVGTGFHPELTGRENVYLNGTLLGMRKREVDEKFDQIVDFAGIEKFIDTPVKRYSTGMKVRLGFSVAAHLEPEILVVDEVLAVGDARFQRKCLDKMKDVGQQGRTVLFVSHNMPAVTRLCERAILLDEGKIIEDGPAGRIVSNYLCSDLGTAATREWQDPARAPAGSVARLSAVRVLNRDGRVTETIDIREPMKLEMEYEVLKSGYVLLPHFCLFNERGECAFVTVDQTPTWRGRVRSNGHYLSSVTIPGNLLAEGILLVDCNLLTLNPDILQFNAKSVVSFNVVDNMEGDSARGDFAKNIPGVVRPLLEWDTQYFSNKQDDNAFKKARKP
jgi:lipopolysaccharide transport system ATP-binding protein